MALCLLDIVPVGPEDGEIVIRKVVLPLMADIHVEGVFHFLL